MYIFYLLFIMMFDISGNELLAMKVKQRAKPKILPLDALSLADQKIIKLKYGAQRSGPHACNFKGCDKEFVHTYGRMMHWLYDHKISAINKCPICPYKENNFDFFRNHIVFHKNRKEQIPAPYDVEFEPEHPLLPQEECPLAEHIKISSDRELFIAQAIQLSRKKNLPISRTIKPKSTEKLEPEKLLIPMVSSPILKTSTARTPSPDNNGPLQIDCQTQGLENDELSLPDIDTLSDHQKIEKLSGVTEEVDARWLRLHQNDTYTSFSSSTVSRSQSPLFCDKSP